MKKKKKDEITSNVNIIGEKIIFWNDLRSKNPNFISFLLILFQRYIFFSLNGLEEIYEIIFSNMNPEEHPLFVKIEDFLSKSFKNFCLKD